jgi:hypothetical protein
MVTVFPYENGGAGIKMSRAALYMDTSLLGYRFSEPNAAELAYCRRG